MARPDNYLTLLHELSDAEDQHLPASEKELADIQHLCDKDCPDVDIIIPTKAHVVEAGTGVWVQGWIWLDDTQRR